MAKGGTAKDPSSNPDPDRAQEAKEKAARATAKPDGQRALDVVTGTLDAMARNMLLLKEALAVLLPSKAIDQEVLDVIGRLVTANEQHQEDLIVVRKDVNKWMAGIQHVLETYNKQHTEMLAERKKEIDKGQQLTIDPATEENFQTMAQAIGDLLTRVVVLEELLTAPDQVPGPEPAPESLDLTNTTPVVAKEAPRIRESSYQRLPRQEARTMVLNDLNNGRWYSAIMLANKHAKPHTTAWRYYKGLYGTHLRELAQEGTLQRRDSKTRGSLYEYRNPTPTQTKP